MLLDEQVIQEHREAIRTTEAALVELEMRKEARATQRKALDATLQALVSTPLTVMPPQQDIVCDAIPTNAPHDPQLAWLDTVRQSILARQIRLDGYKEESLKVKEDEQNDDHQAFISSIDANLKARSEQRKARLQQLQATSRFFGVPTHGAEREVGLESPGISVH